LANLLEVLKAEHIVIFNVLKEAINLCVSTSKGHEKLMHSKDTMLEHLDKEDEEFYPALRKAAENDDRLRQLLVQFDDDMKEVSEVAHDFFNRYSTGCTDIDFLQDFGMFFMMLKERMSKEENVLFPEYEKIRASGDWN
jgi:hemerythrin-like domain-containing protein